MPVILMAQVICTYPGENECDCFENKVDCANVCNGNAMIDNCDVCDTDATNDCLQDCAGVWGGSSAAAVLCANGNIVCSPDDCSLENIYGCTDDTACNYISEAIEDDGTCEYIFDCENICGGSAAEDNCGNCDSDATNNCTQDCFGIWGGILLVDECGVCDGPGDVFECGCEDLAEDSCDCDGSELDQCNVCGGPGAIYDCGCNDITDEACDCDGNDFDTCGICGGTALNSEDCRLDIDIVGNPQNIGIINAYPNPFNSSTSILIWVHESTFVKLDIFDLNGNIISGIYSGYLSELNAHTFLWDGAENNSGIYFARISQKNKIFTHKIILLK